MIFVAVFITFLTQCVDYSAIPQSSSLSQVLYPQCTKNISGMPNVAIWLFALYAIWQLWLLLVDISRLMRLHDFFFYLLEVPDRDIQTVSWQEIVARLMVLRDSNPLTVEKITPANRKFLGTQSKQRLDAHDIANRLMRRENYFIALFNKEILDLTLPLPFLHGRQLFSRTLHWNLNWCIMDLIFNEQNQVNQLILKDTHRRELSDALRDRFLFAAFMNVLFAPVIVMYLLTVYFLRYFNVSCSLNTAFSLPANALLGISKESFSYWVATVHSTRRMEIPGIQRGVSPLRKASQHVISIRFAVFRSISEEKDGRVCQICRVCGWLVSLCPYPCNSLGP